jgi:hypothetical protein
MERRSALELTRFLLMRELIPFLLSAQRLGLFLTERRETAATGYLFLSFGGAIVLTSDTVNRTLVILHRKGLVWLLQ